MEGFNRLYAFPSKPEFFEYDELVILDSGAFGLYKSGGHMSKSYMERLSAHYFEYSNKSEKVICVAPDVAGDIAGSILNVKKWLDAGLFPRIKPVFHFSARRCIDPNVIKQQIRAYLDIGFKLDFVLCPKAGEYGVNAAGTQIKKCFSLLREGGATHIHLLGAGWDNEDIEGWAKVGGFDTMDSTMYYVAAKRGESWDGAEYNNYKKRAVANANFANNLMELCTTK